MIPTTKRVLSFGVVLLALLLAESCHAWVIGPRFAALRSFRSNFAFARKSSVDSFSLESLTNYEEDGALMAKSIAAWLDAEWMPQEVHIQMGNSAKESYLSCRNAGQSDLMTIMTTVADDLTENWEEYDKDAFVNAWDIANYVSDFLVQRSGAEACECSTKIH